MFNLSKFVFKTLTILTVTGQLEIFMCRGSSRGSSVVVEAFQLVVCEILRSAIHVVSVAFR